VDIAHYAGFSGFRLTVEGYTCELDNCGEVTTGIYVGVGELGDASLMRKNLQTATGLNLAAFQ
jgi:hypothetical protein